MKTAFDIQKLIAAGFIKNEQEYERAMIADRKLRLLAKENQQFKQLRKQLRDILAIYEEKVWHDETAINDEKLLESELAEKIAEEERVFIEKRKNAIRNGLKSLELTQEDLARILGHKSKTHMSELINGIKPFTLYDLVVIRRLLRINLDVLIPTHLPFEKIIQIKSAVKEINKPKLNRLTAFVR